MDWIRAHNVRAADGYFAITEAVVAIATLLARFSVVAESAEIPLLTQITLRLAGPLWCRLELQSAAREP